jgi:hypothetical protein
MGIGAIFIQGAVPPVTDIMPQAGGLTGGEVPSKKGVRIYTRVTYANTTLG